MLDRNRLGVIGIALAIVLFFAVNILAGALIRSTRLDLTEDKLFTLSDGTKRVLSTMEEPVDLRLYYSDRLDETGPYFSAHAPGRGAARRDQRRSGGRCRSSGSTRSRSRPRKIWPSPRVWRACRSARTAPRPISACPAATAPTTSR